MHHYEGAWTDMGSPYWGGLQFNASFESTYNPWARAYYGHAGRWPIHAQLHAAWRAWRVRGWTPWPQTAAWCGLL